MKRMIVWLLCFAMAFAPSTTVLAQEEAEMIESVIEMEADDAVDLDDGITDEDADLEEYDEYSEEEWDQDIVLDEILDEGAEEEDSEEEIFLISEELEEMEAEVTDIYAELGEVSVLDFGANGKDQADDSDAFEAALRLANSTKGTLTVIIPEGTYYLSNGLDVFSDTTIIATGAKIIARFWKGAMLHDAHFYDDGRRCYAIKEFPDCPHGGYTRAKNITLIGGEWDRNSTFKAEVTDVDNSMMRFKHCSGITVKNAIFENGTNHYLNFSASENILVENCVFRNHIITTPYGDLSTEEQRKAHEARFGNNEAIHLDSASAEPGQTDVEAYPVDGTSVRNATIKNCTFDNLNAGVGNHHLIVNGNKDRTAGVTIEGCTFKNMRYRSIVSHSFGQLIIRNNSIEGGTLGIDLRDASDVLVENNTISNVRDYFLRTAVNSRNVAVNGNQMDRAGVRGVYILDGSEVSSVNGNTIINAGEQGVYVRDSGTYVGEICGNTISDTEKDGIYVYSGAKVSNVSDNNVQKANRYGIQIKSPGTVTASGNYVRSTNIAINVGGVNGTLTAVIDGNDARTSAGSGDIVLYDNCTDCQITNNTLGVKGYRYPSGSVEKDENNVGSNVVTCPNVTVAGKAAIQTVTLNPTAAAGTIKLKTSVSGATVSGYKITLPKNYSGKFSVTVTASGSNVMTATATAKVLVKPAPTAIASLRKTAKGTFTAKWAKNAYSKGYQLMYALDSKFKNKPVTVKIPTNGTVSKKVSKLKAGKTYYVRLRTINVIDGVTYYSAWSTVKRVKV